VCAWYVNTASAMDVTTTTTTYTTNMFKNRLDNFQQCQDIVYDFIAQIHKTKSRKML